MRPRAPKGYGLLLLPMALVMLAVVGWPMLRTIWLSFTDAQLIQAGAPRFVGLANFREMLSEPGFLRALKVSAIFALVVVSVEMLLGVSVGVLLAQQFRGCKVVRGLLVIPWALPTMVNAIMWRLIYNPEYGALNSALFQLGFIKDYFNWLSDARTVLPAIMYADIWKNFSLVALIVLGILQSMPQDQLEAAHLDGAGFFRRFFHVTLPYISPPLQVALVLRIIEATKVFDIVYVMTRGGPANSTRTGSIFVYQEAFRNGYIGTGTSAALMMVLLILLLVWGYLRMLKLDEGGGR